MPSEYQESITNILKKLKTGDDNTQREAIKDLWEIYFQQLIIVARQRISDFPRRAKDEEDILISVFDSLWNKARSRSLDGYLDRFDLMKLLVTITKHRVYDYKRGEMRDKRDISKVSDDATEDVVSQEPTAEFVVELQEDLEMLLSQLGDELLRNIAVKRMEGLSLRELAYAFQRSTRTIERKLDLIRSVWRKHLGNGGLDSVF